MGMPELVVAAVLSEGRSKSEVARQYGVSRRWVITLVQRFLTEGEAGLVPRSRRPHHSPNQVAAAIEDQIIAIRKELDRDGHEAGAATIAYHLEHRHGHTPGGQHDLADPERPRLRHTPTPQTTQVQLLPIPARTAQRDVGHRHHPLDARGRHRRGDPQHPGRPLPLLPDQHHAGTFKAHDVDHDYTQTARRYGDRDCCRFG